MSDKHTDTDPKLPNWLHRVHFAVTNFNVPRPVWLAYLVWCLDNNFKHMRQERDKSNECDESCEPHQPVESSKCGIFTCGSGDQYCYCVRNYKFDECIPNELGWFRCPSTSKLCHVSTCKDNKCKNQSDCQRHQGGDNTGNY